MHLTSKLDIIISIIYTYVTLMYLYMHGFSYYIVGLTVERTCILLFKSTFPDMYLVSKHDGSKITQMH